MTPTGVESATRRRNLLTLGVCVVAVLGVYIYFMSGTNTARREAELTKVIHNYEESVFLKKVEVYRNEVKRKEAECLARRWGCVQLEEERAERERIAGELIKANEQIDTANQELLKANKIIEDEAIAITEWKAKTTQLEADFFNVRKNRDELKQQNEELVVYSKKKDSALEMVMTSLKETEQARKDADALRAEVEKRLEQADSGKSL